MSGKEDYVEEQLNKQVKVMEDLSKNLFLDRININQQAEKYLSLTEELVEKMTAEELGVGEYILSSYGFAVQRKINRSQAIKNWANKCLERIIAKNYSSFDQMMKYEIRKAAITTNDEYAKRLSDIIMQQDLLLDELSYLSQSIYNISNSLANLGRIRNKKHAFATREN